MIEGLNQRKVKEIEETWKKGEDFEDEGYGDLGFTLKAKAIEDILKLDKANRKIAVNLIWPKE